jgi:hypothetical protein
VSPRGGKGLSLRATPPLKACRRATPLQALGYAPRTLGVLLAQQGCTPLDTLGLAAPLPPLNAAAGSPAAAIQRGEVFGIRFLDKV